MVFYLSFIFLCLMPNISFQQSVQNCLMILFAVSLIIFYLQRMQCISTSRYNVRYSSELSRDTS